MKTVIYYYSATGNSLYVARELQKAIPEAEVCSVVQALQAGQLTVCADRVGFVFPMHYFGLPLQVEEFLEKLSISGTPYLFAIATCGVPYWGRPFLDAERILAKKHCTLQAAWYWRLVSNYILWGDLAAAWRIRIRAWLAARKLRKICAAVAQRKTHKTWQLMPKFCQGYHEKWRQRQEQIDEGFSCETGRCTGCGFCERICPRGNIIRPEGAPVWQHRCVECLGCIHICPVQAIDYGRKTQGRQRYRHKEIKASELLLR